MNLNRKIASLRIMLIIIACLGVLLMVVAPVEDVDAWPYHVCCDWEIDWFVNGNIFELRWDCDHHFHPHIKKCDFECP